MGKKEHIISTAIKLFVEQGFEHTPTSQISKVANVATGTLFHHFKTKEDLINAAYLHVKSKAMEDMRDDAHEKLQERFRNAWMKSLEWGCAHKREIEFVFMYSDSVYITEQTRDKGQLIMEPFTKIFDDGVKQKVFKNLPRAILIGTYCGIYQKFFKHVCAKKFDKKLATQGFSLVWDALKK